MKILVFVKQVPDTDDVKLDPKTGNLKRDGVQTTINPLDANAVETAVQLKEKYGATVCAVTMGPPQAKEVLKRRWHSAAMKPIFSPIALSAAPIPVQRATLLQRLPRRSATTTCCCSAVTPLTATPRRPAPRLRLS